MVPSMEDGPYWVHPRLVAVEGLMCSGKSTLVRRIEVELKKRFIGVEVIRLTRFNPYFWKIINKCTPRDNVLQNIFRAYIMNEAVWLLNNTRDEIVIAERWVASHLLYSVDLIGYPPRDFWMRVPLPLLWIVVKRNYQSVKDCLRERTCGDESWPEVKDYKWAQSRLIDYVEYLAGMTNSKVIIVNLDTIKDFERLVGDLVDTIISTIKSFKGVIIKW